MKACAELAMPRRSGARSSAISVTTGTISAQPKEKTDTVSIAQNGCGVLSRFIATLTTEVPSMMTKPRRIWCLGLMRPASRPDSQAPSMMPDTLMQKNQKNCVGCSCRMSPSHTGALSTYRNMPLKGMPLASASIMKCGLRIICT